MNPSKWLLAFVFLAFSAFLPDSRAGWGPSGCNAAPVAVATYAQAQADGWFESAQFPGWWVRYERGRVAEWQEMPKAPKPIGQREQVDRDAVLRLGNWVHHVDGSHRDSLAGLWGQVMGPPASDSHKWFVSVIGMQRCPGCAKLKQDWATDEHLRAMAKPELANQRDSWAHFAWYDKTDDTQQWRWKGVEVTGYPTVIVQPPRNRQFGDPKTVVFQQTYGKDSSPSQLAADMRSAIKAYLVTLPNVQREEQAAASLPASGVIAAPPPNHVKPKVDAPADPNILPADPADHKQIPPKKAPVIPGGNAVLEWAKANWMWLAVAGVLLLLFKDKIVAGLNSKPGATSPTVLVEPKASLKPLTVDDGLVAALTDYAKQEQVELSKRKTADESRAKVKQTMLLVASAAPSQRGPAPEAKE